MRKIQDLITRAVRAWLPEHHVFENHRPDWLNGMEIDIFIPSLKLGIEVQGRQHHFYCPTLQGTYAEHLAQIERDKQKRILAGNRGIELISVREGCSLLFAGLHLKLTHRLKRKLKTPRWMKAEWKEHRSLLGRNFGTNYIAFKVRSGGRLCPVNRASSDYAKRFGISMIPRTEASADLATG